MKIRLLIVLGLIFHFSLRAQNYEKVNYVFDFSNNNHNFFTTQGYGYEMTIKNGNYHLKAFDYTLITRNYVNIDLNKDFTYILRFKYYGGFTFVWSTNLKNYLAVKVTSEPVFTVFEYDYKTRLSNPLYSGKIHISLDYNVLKISKKGNITEFYFNGKLLTKQKIDRFYSPQFAFLVDEYSEAYIDYLKVSGYREKINLSTKFLGYEKERLGNGVNSPYEEIVPIITADGKNLYFIRNDHPENIGGQDVWTSVNIDGTWQKARNLGSPVNTLTNDGAFFISPDNSRLYLSHGYSAFGDPLENKPMAVSYKQKDGSWSIPKNIDILGYDNFYFLKSFALSADEQILLLATENEDSYGMLDLYVCFRIDDKTFSYPKNLGSVINTPGREFSPFLAPDGKTLYFASDGHPGYGSADLFVTKRLDDTWQHWTKPLNLGPVVNSPDWDANLTIDAKGEYAYFTSGSAGSKDIYKIKLQDEQKPDPVVIVYGKVLNKKTLNPISARISYSRLPVNKNVASISSNPQTGEYQIVLPYGQKYQIHAEKKGFFPVSDMLDLSKVSGFKKIRRDLFLLPIEKNQTYVLNNVFFDRGKSDLKQDSYEELDRVVELMKQNPEIEIEVSGHTNNIGDMSKLMELSRKRAEAVKQYLVDHGIAASRIKTVGYGPKKPVASNDTPEGRKKNQRVEFKIIEK